MKLPEYITVDEVKRVCSELGIRDWTTLKSAQIMPEEAKIILQDVNVEGMNIDLDEFKTGLEVELEHGLRFNDANVTNNHPVLTGKIVIAHLKETLDYYKRLDVAEIEGDLLKAIVSKNSEKAISYYEKLIKAKLALSKVEAKELG